MDMTTTTAPLDGEAIANPPPQSTLAALLAAKCSLLRSTVAGLVQLDESAEAVLLDLGRRLGEAESEAQAGQYLRLYQASQLSVAAFRAEVIDLRAAKETLSRDLERWGDDLNAARQRCVVLAEERDQLRRECEGLRQNLAEVCSRLAGCATERDAALREVEGLRVLAAEREVAS